MDRTESDFRCWEVPFSSFTTSLVSVPTTVTFGSGFVSFFRVLVSLELLLVSCFSVLFLEDCTMVANGGSFFSLLCVETIEASSLVCLFSGRGATPLSSLNVYHGSHSF